MLELVPVGGLCNRMRAIDSAVSFSVAYDVPLRIWWRKDKKDINCRFRDLFSEIEQVSIHDVDTLPLRFRLRQQNYFYRPNPLRRILNTEGFLTEVEVMALIKEGRDFWQLYKDHRRLNLFSFSRFFDTEKPYEIFDPIPKVKEMVAQETHAFDDRTVGMHIRRGDHEISRKNSPLERFESIIDEELSRDADVQFYVASDCASTKKYLVDKYGTSILGNPAAGDRSSLHGMYTGVTELYALSKTRKIYGSFGSSYSGTAAILAGVERIQVR